ncbi:HET-domain-containing protein, partial [Byssothecium circinans]
WVSFCDNHHPGCRIKPTSFVKGLKLIDCTNRSIVSAYRWTTYVALSYVWGADQQNTDQTSIPINHPQNTVYQLPDTVPPVIEDSICAVRELGYQYLWVDRYCIDQSNQEEKHFQIARMNSIYERAELTIIATGDDQSYGLPGVNMTPRRPQHTAVAKGINLVLASSNRRKTILASRWATRGWTYQEYILARRRLVFLEDQVYFECNGMNCYE